MNAIAFDTLDATKTLRGAGVDERMAEAIVSVVQRTVELPPTDHLATRVQVDAQFEAVRVQIDGLTKRFDDLKATVYAAVGFQTVGLVGVAAFLYAVLKHA